MRHLIVLVFMFACCSTAIAQRFEIGPFVGGANYIGDVGSTAYINPSGLVVGGIAKWNAHPRYSFRGSIMYGFVSGDDAKSNEIRRQQRSYTFDNKIAEASLGLEFNFWEFDLTDAIQQGTPYLYSGITYFHSNHQILTTSLPTVGNLRESSGNWEFSVPIIFGYKQTITSKIIGAIEVGARYTFTDNLDGSNPQELLGRREPAKEFGNKNTNDWYIFSGISLTFTFGQKPCYCN